MKRISMNYEEMSAVEISVHFISVTRQRMSQLIWQWRDNIDVSARMVVARGLVNDTNYEEKCGFSKDLNLKTKWRWKGMNARCGNACGRYPAYADCTVGFASHKEFAIWSESQFGFDIKGYHLDKDILIKGNTLYSENTCVFVPGAVNRLMVGNVSSRSRGSLPIGVCYNKENRNYMVQMKAGNHLKGYVGSFATPEAAFESYKVAKEAHIQKVANDHKNMMDVRAYDALMRYVVEITD